MKSDLIDVTVCKHAETEKALLVSDDGIQSNAVWIPKSQCEIESKKEGGASAWILTLPEWLANDKGLI